MLIVRINHDNRGNRDSHGNGPSHANRGNHDSRGNGGNRANGANNGANSGANDDANNRANNAANRSRKHHFIPCRFFSSRQSIPLLSRSAGTFAIVLSPTRELCTQVVGVATKLVAKCAKIVPGQLVGGENKTHQKARIRKGITLLVATPGKGGRKGSL